MNTARKNCIWRDQCGSECRECEDYSPFDDMDDTEKDEKFYRRVLEENAQEYGKIIAEFSDEGVR